MAGRGPQTFKKRQKEQQRKERQQAKAEKRLQRQREGPQPEEGDAETNQAGETPVAETDALEPTAHAAAPGTV